jgi:hypothetical protein
MVDYPTCDDVNNEPGALIGRSRDLGHLSGFQSKQNGDSALGEHRHGFNVCCCGTKDTPSNRIRRFRSIPYGNVVLSGPCAVSNLDDPTESLVAHARLTSPTDKGIEASSAADRARTTPMVTPLSEPKCSRVAITAISASGMATLKYCRDGAPKMAGPTHGVPSALLGVMGAGRVSWTTQPAGVALSLMHRRVTLFADGVYAADSATARRLYCRTGKRWVDGDRQAACGERRKARRFPLALNVSQRLANCCAVSFASNTSRAKCSSRWEPVWRRIRQLGSCRGVSSLVRMRLLGGLRPSCRR